MRPWTIPILGAVALSLAAPAPVDARPRFGPGMILGAFAAPLAMLSGGRSGAAERHSAQRHQRVAQERGTQEHSEEHSTQADSTDGRRSERSTRSERQAAATGNLVASGSVFWPRASGDLLDYAFFPRGKDEAFWTVGYGAILGNAFATANTDDRRLRRSRSASNKVSDAAGTTGMTELSGGLDKCGNLPAARSADQLIERIEQTIRPSDPQRAILAELHIALMQAIERINGACPATVPTTATERLQAIHDRISAMRDALLTVRLPFERLYASLSGDQDWRLAREADAREVTGTTAQGRKEEARSQMCTEQASEIAGWPMQAIGRALQPNEQQRASLEMLRMRLAGMAQLVINSCPTYPLLGPMGRIAALSDRLDVMQFAVSTMTPALPDFYESLSDKQRLSVSRIIRQFTRRSAKARDGA
jgi:hypothetical protein